MYMHMSHMYAYDDVYDAFETSLSLSIYMLHRRKSVVDSARLRTE